MTVQATLGFSDHLTHKANLRNTRYGWLRLTPAYSVHLVSELLDTIQHQDAVVLDPFMGTGTTALVCAEKGLKADTTDINPFLIWLTRTKTATYDCDTIEYFLSVAQQVMGVINTQDAEPLWTPPLYQIEKWWDDETLNALARIMGFIRQMPVYTPKAVIDLLKISFCRTLIDRANVSFGHQSMSFKKDGNGVRLHTATDDVRTSWKSSVLQIGHSAGSPVSKEPRVMLNDARDLGQALEDNRYSCVITSPPYPNRMSYIRELRPYMYWLGYLEDSRSAGELDWQAIGGTWGIATSRVAKWKPETIAAIPFEGFEDLIQRIGEKSPVLSKYVHKYFYDMVYHSLGLFHVVRPGGVINYIVGNSKFYDVLLPVEAIYASLFRRAGFENVVVKAIRKRSSKKELFEYLVSAKKPLHA